MHLNASYRKGREKVYNCIARSLRVDVRNVPIFYVSLNRFYHIIKANLKKKHLNNPYLIEKLTLSYLKIVPGLWKRDEQRVYIKETFSHDFCLLLSELLHSKSIIQQDNYAKEWIKEGLPHYIAKLLCEMCGIRYIKSEHSKYFQFWERIYRKTGLNFLRNILFAQRIEIAKALLKSFLGYEREDIFELSFEDARDLLSN